MTGTARERPVAPGAEREFKPASRGDAFSRLFERASSGEG